MFYDKQPEKRLNEKDIESVMNDLVSAWEAVHDEKQDIYHLDLKPDNVLITDEKRLVLIDFGAARQGLRKNSRSVQAFTESYAAPEVILGEDAGSYSDLFELEMMLHEMLTGELPLLRKSLMTLRLSAVGDGQLWGDRGISTKTPTP
ncbi:MAG: protein kinase domain-containing protein [Microcystis sp.]|nr:MULTISPECIES: protein kinase [unclassified Microcystis]MCZ8053894.1 protein kinase [Microcystis sp. LE19-12.2C]MDJ0551536.1 protein kinase [Microcystis sp. M49637_WE12]MDJ0585687.1 protein kinase [Microcystis sp. M49636_WE2]